MRAKISLILLAMAMPAVLSAGLLDTSVTLSIPTIHDYFFYTGCVVTPSTTCPTIINRGMPVPPVTGFHIPQPIPDSITSGSLTVMGLDVTGMHVVIGLASSVTITGTDWTTLFSTPQSQIIGDLLSGSSSSLADLTNFFAANLSDFVPYSTGVITTGNIGEFSTGVVVGSLSTSLAPVPEPGTLTLTGLLLAGAVLLRRRQQSH